jgi:hypothetical protein
MKDDMIVISLGILTQLKTAIPHVQAKEYWFTDRNQINISY